VPEFLSPGVYVEEVSFRAKSIEGVPTNTTALIGFAERGPLTPFLVTSAKEFEESFGGPRPHRYLWHAVRGFFQNGGTRCFILRLAEDSSAPRDVVSALDAVDEVSLVCCPDEHGVAGMAAALVEHCERMRYRIAVLGAPDGSDLEDVPPHELQSPRAAYYAPWVKVANAAGGAAIAVHPGGHICGAIAANDIERGVHKAPANIILQGVVDVERNISQREQEPLNQRGINVIRSFPGRGILIWGARTTSRDAEWKYVNIRRYFNYLEKSIDQGTQWVVFEPNGEQLWSNVKRTIEDFLLNQWADGALLGRKLDEAFFVKCDRTTMTQDDIDNGRLVCLVGVAAVRPAEFVIFRIGQWTADAKRCP
jgi:uncharacterized protein